MTQQGLYTYYDEELQPQSENNDQPDRTSVRDMIRRFEKTGVSVCDYSESSENDKETLSDVLTGVVNPIHAHFQLYPAVRTQDRNSNVSVNSILSNVSEISCESSSSGFVSDRKSCADGLVPHRPAPPPPLSVDSPSTPTDVTSTERRFSFTTSSSCSPVVLRRTRQAPVIRKKSMTGSQGHRGETLWSYGVKQIDLEKLLRLKPSDVAKAEKAKASANILESCSSSDESSEDLEKGRDYTVNDDSRNDTTSADYSTDTLINEDVASDEGDNFSVNSGASGENSNYDNVSIKSISSFDMVPYQKYDSITVSSDEFGSEVCHAPDKEFLTVSAVNEWCVTQSEEPVLLPVETKKEKYRRRLTERVNELIHTESVYVDRLRHVVEDYIPEMSREDLSNEFKELKSDIFSNIELLFQFHEQEFLPALRDCENDLRKLGQCFRNFEQKFNMYVMYSRNNKRATRLVFEYKEFFMETQMKLGDRLDLSSYLLEPVQRIPRYKLFLDDLVKTYTNYESERDETESRISKLSVASDETGGSNGESSETSNNNEETPLESLEQAKIMIECVLTAIDEIMALESIKHLPANLNLLKQGRLLRQNEFYATDNVRRRRQLMKVFLFDKLVLLTAIYKKQMPVEIYIYKDHFPVSDLGITAKEQAFEQHKFTIWYRSRNLKSYKLETREPQVRIAWVEDIHSLLWKQALHEKELLIQQRSKRASLISTNSQDSEADSGDKYNSLRGVPGEVRRRYAAEKKARMTTWYCEMNDNNR